MTPSQEYTARYKHTVKKADARGRIIEVGRLRISQQLKVMEMYPNLEGETEISNPDGTKSKLDRRFMPMLAASVRSIDGAPYPFPQSRAVMDSLLDNLDVDGMSAIVMATAELSGVVVLEQADGTT